MLLLRHVVVANGRVHGCKLGCQGRVVLNGKCNARGHSIIVQSILENCAIVVSHYNGDVAATRVYTTPL